MPLKLSNKRDNWVKSRDYDGIMRGLPQVPSDAIGNDYRKKLDKLTRQMMDVVERDIKKLFHTGTAEEYFSEDASIASQSRILMDALTAHMLKIFSQRATRLAEDMIGAANKQSAASVHASLKELSGGLSLSTRQITGSMEEIIKASVAENVGLIKSIAQKYLEEVQGAVMRSITTGSGLQYLVPFLSQRRGITLRRARLIAIDQTKKVTVALNRERNKKLGITKFEWIHSSASKEPRELHLSYNGKIFSYDDPPVIDERTGERGLPSQAINCKCIARPIIEFTNGVQDDS